MCGRYTLICIDDLGRRFRLVDPTLGFRSRFNIAPGQIVPVIIRRGAHELTAMQWGLSCGTGKKQSPVSLINARSETLAERPYFRRLLEDRRCLVPATGFYEWAKKGPHRIPFYFRLRGGPFFAFAGLYDSVTDSSGGVHLACTIITTAANSLVAPVHDRMPVLLSPEFESRWLSGEMPSLSELTTILSPRSSTEMETYPVSTRVNNAGLDDEELIRPLNTLT